MSNNIVVALYTFLMRLNCNIRQQNIYIYKYIGKTKKLFQESATLFIQWNKKS